MRFPSAVVVFTVALALRLVFVASTTITPISDAERYLGHAERLLAGQGFVSVAGSPTAYTPPGYPFFIAAVQSVFGPGHRPVAYVQAVLGAVVCLLTFVLCRRLFDGRHAVAASLLLAISPTTIPYSGGLLSEVLTTLVVVGVLLLLAQVYESKNDASVPFPLARIAVAGLILGAGILLRPAVIALAVGMGLYLLMRRSRRLPERVVAAGIFTLAAIAVVTPWSYRNYRVFGAFVPISTNGGYDLYLGNNPQAVGGGWMPLDEGEHRPGDGTGDEVRVDRDAQDRAILWMRQYPLDYAELTIKRSVRWLSAAPDNVAGTRLTSTEEVDEAIFRAYRARAQGVALPESPAVKRSARLNSTVVFVWSLIMIPLALAGIVIDLSRGARWLVLAPLLSYALVLSLAFMQLRFREAVMPLILMYASVGAFGLPSLRQQWAQASPMSKAALVLGIPLFMAFGLQLMRDRGTISSILGGG